jgi:hypothetical protein
VAIINETLKNKYHGIERTINEGIFFGVGFDVIASAKT